MYVEMTVEEAMKRCNKNTRVLVAMENLEGECDSVFVIKKQDEYQGLFDDAKTIASCCDDFVNELNIFTKKQHLPNVEPVGIRKIILLRE